jgi:hypothetical protein
MQQFITHKGCILLVEDSQLFYTRTDLASDRCDANSLTNHAYDLLFFNGLKQVIAKLNITWFIAFLGQNPTIEK